MRRTTHARLQPLLESQDGVITSCQLSMAGVDPELPRRERWTTLAPRVWLTAGGPPADEQLLQALRLHAGPSGVPSGPLACRRHGLRDVPDSGAADVLVPHGRRLVSGGLTVVHQSTRLPRTVRREGWQVASAPRAVADAARWSGELRAVRALVLAALSDLLVRHAELLDEQRHGERRGRAVLGRALEDWERGARSAPEAEAADALGALPGSAALPTFWLNPSLFLDGHLLGVPDGYLPGCGLGWEVDSVRHHGGADDLAATLTRHTTFSTAGIELVHVVPAVLRRDPAGWARAFAARAQARAAAGLGEPAGLVVRPHDALIARDGRLIA